MKKLKKVYSYSVLARIDDAKILKKWLCENGYVERQDFVHSGYKIKENYLNAPYAVVDFVSEVVATHFKMVWG